MLSRLVLSRFRLSTLDGVGLALGNQDLGDFGTLGVLLGDGRVNLLLSGLRKMLAM